MRVALSRWVPKALGILLAWLVLSESRVLELRPAADDIDWLLLAGIVALNVPSIGLWVFRSFAVLTTVGYVGNNRLLVASSVLGNAAALLTPGGAGDAVRAAWLIRKVALPGSAAAAVVLYERLYLPVLMGLWLAATVGAALVGDVALLVTVPIALATGIVVPTLFLGVLRLGKIFARSRAGPWFSVGLMTGWARQLRATDRWLAGSFKHRHLSVRFATATFAVHAISGTQAWLLLERLDPQVGVAGVWAAYTGGAVAGWFSLLPGGIGSSDAAFVVILAGFGVEPIVGAQAALLIRLAQTLPQGLAGLGAHIYLSTTRPQVPSLISSGLAVPKERDDEALMG